MENIYTNNMILMTWITMDTNNIKSTLIRLNGINNCFYEKPKF